jgi:hypothetical protein
MQWDTYLTSFSFWTSLGFIFSKALKPWLITRRKAAGISYGRNFLPRFSAFAILKTIYVYYTKDTKSQNKMYNKNRHNKAVTLTDAIPVCLSTKRYKLMSNTTQTLCISFNILCELCIFHLIFGFWWNIRSLC